MTEEMKQVLKLKSTILSKNNTHNLYKLVLLSTLFLLLYGCDFSFKVPKQIASEGIKEGETLLKPGTANTEKAENTLKKSLVDTGLTILFLGDSLTEGYDLVPEQSYPSLVEGHFKDSGKKVSIVNAGISGDTTLGGLNRFKWYLTNKTYEINVLFLALGANDGLRGLPVENTYKNLSEIIALAKKANMKVVLAGIEVPPNYGTQYTANFRNVYNRLQIQYALARMPFLLKDVAGKADLNLEDGLHPNAKGYTIIAQNVYNVLNPIIEAMLKR